MAEPLRFAYINHRREVSERAVTQPRLVWRASEWHGEEEQWILEAWDTEKEAWRDFSVRDILHFIRRPE